MSSRRHVHLSAEATTILREVSRSAAADIARVLDSLAESGARDAQLDDESGQWHARVPAGDYVVVVGGRVHDDRIIVVDIQLRESEQARHVADTIPLRISTRRRLVSAVMGFRLDLLYTLRSLRRSPFFSMIVVVTLALGFGGATALMDLVHTVYRGALPFGDGEQLVRIRNASGTPATGVRRYNVTPSDYFVMRENNRVFSDVVAQEGRSLSLLGDQAPERVSAIGVSPRWIALLKVRPILGRPFNAAEESAGSQAGVALISHALWQRRFGGDSSIVGQLLRHDRGAETIVGVMPPGINYPYEAAVWTPWTFDPSNITTSSLNLVARLQDGVSLESARRDAERVHSIRAEGRLHGAATGIDVATLRSDFIRDDARVLQALSVAVLFLLMLACMNVTHLLVARFASRRAELGVRAALGARRDQQLRQLMMESGTLFALGGAGGMWLATVLRSSLNVVVPDTLRLELGFDGTDIGLATMSLALLSGIAAGLVVGGIAAARAVRSDVAMLVKAGGRASMSVRDRRLFDGLVVTQLGLSLVLLLGAGLLIGRFRQLSETPTAYDISGVSTIRLTVEQDRYRDGNARLQLVRALQERISALPGVTAVGITTVNPLCCGDWAAPISIDGRAVSPDDPPILVAHSYVTPGYLKALSVPIIQGQGFDENDRPGGELSVVIDAAFANMAWPGLDPLGRRVRIARDRQEWRTVVGVIPVRENSSDTRAAWFLPYYQDPTGASTEQLHIMMRHNTPVSVATLQEIVATMDPSLAAYGMTTMEDLRSQRIQPDRLGAVVATVFGGFAMLLAAFSLYGMLAYTVEMRRTEIGTRMALGASRKTVVGLIVRQSAVRFAIGVAIGLVLAAAANGILRSEYSDLASISWTSLGSAIGLLGLVATVAAVVPVLRATRTSPVEILRSR